MILRGLSEVIVVFLIISSFISTEASKSPVKSVLVEVVNASNSLRTMLFHDSIIHVLSESLVVSSSNISQDSIISPVNIILLPVWSVAFEMMSGSL